MVSGHLCKYYPKIMDIRVKNNKLISIISVFFVGFCGQLYYLIC